MVGFTLCLNDSLDYNIIWEIKAGDTQQVNLLPGESIKIFTGAAVPDSTPVVIQIEKVSVQENILQLEEHPKIRIEFQPCWTAK